MTRSTLLIVLLTCFTSNLLAQDNFSLKDLREDFNSIESEADVQSIIDLPVDPEDPEAATALAYQAASTCMMAEYVFSPIKKLKYFNRGKSSLEELIAEDKSVENVYLRLLIQLNIPRLLNYYKNIDEDIAYLEAELPGAKIDVDYKYNMIRNLVTLAEKDEIKKKLLGIKVTGIDENM